MKRSLAALAVALAVPLVLDGCAPAETGPTFTAADSAAIVSTVEQAVALANESSGWIEYVGVYYHPDATVMPANSGHLQGHEEILAFLEAFPPLVNFSFEMDLLEGAGDIAHVVGRYQMELDLPEGVMVDYGKYIEIWHRQDDGSWKIVYDIFNSDLPLP